MDGGIKGTEARRRSQPLVPAEAPAPGAIARAFHAVKSLVPLRVRRTQDDTAPVALAATRSRRPWVLISFIGFVIVPALIADLYIIFIAADEYVAETRAVVRSAEQESPAQSSGASGSPLGSSISLSPITPNAYIVTNYIRSRGIVDALEKVVDLREIFRRPEADFWARLERNATIEELVDYWNRMVTAYVDGPSGIVTVKIRAFRRDDALTLSRAVVRLSEQLVNEISERARRDAMQFAEVEVRRADARVRAALIELRRYRDDEGLIDPVKTADETAKLMMQLLAEKIRLEGDLFVASRSMSKDAPSIQNLTARVEIIDVQIAKLRANLTGESADVRNIAAKLARFEELEVQRQFAEKLYTMAQDGLERARITAERQSVYLTVFVPPSLPEEATFPRRTGLAIIMPLAFLMLWSIGALIWASVEDHRV